MGPVSQITEPVSRLAEFAATDRQREAVLALEKHGSQAAAAKSIGCGRTTFQDLIGRVRKREEAARSATSPLQDPKDLRRKISLLEETINKQVEQIERLRGTKFRLPTGSVSKSRGKSFCRIAMPDSHGCIVDELAISAFLADLEAISPHEVIMLGDHLDCGGFLAQHHTLGYVAQTEYTFEDDVVACNTLLDRMQSLSPHAEFNYLEGNHERRLETWCVTQSLRNQADANYLRRMFSVESVLALEKRGVNLVKQGVFYDGLSIPATIKRGHCYFTHGSSTAQHAASAHVRKFGGNVVYGHTHRADSFMIRTVKEGAIGAWSPGCLCKLQPLWQHTNPTEWSHGYGLQLANEDGTFLHINVPIIDGKSYMQPLVKAIE